MITQKTFMVKVLVVDDEEIARFAAINILKDLGCYTDEASSGHEALEKISKQKYDLIFMDLGVFDMDGFKMTREIRSKGINTPIIVVTGYHQESMKKHAADLGLINYIIKPLTVEHCKKILDKYIHT